MFVYESMGGGGGGGGVAKLWKIFILYGQFNLTWNNIRFNVEFSIYMFMSLGQLQNPAWHKAFLGEVNLNEIAKLL